MTDPELLRQFAETGSQDAFAQLVRRYADLVYSSALRQVHNDIDAEDIAQAAFLALALKASRLRSHTVLGAWLLRTVRYAASHHLRAQSRRKRHEREVARMTPNIKITEERLPWDEIAPVLDEALTALGRKSCDVLVLRYLQHLSVRQIADRLGVTEEACKKRAQRALEQLRSILRRRGISTTSEAAIGTALLTHAVHEAPVNLPDATMVMFSNSARMAPVWGLAKGALTMTAWTKFLASAACLTALLLIGTAGLLVGKGASPSAQAAAGDSHASPNGRRPVAPDPAAEELVRAIEKAYRGIQTCEIRQELQIRDPDTGKEQPGGWRRCLVFDRRRASFRNDDWFGESSTPTVVTVCNGRKMWERDLRPLYSSFVGKDGKEDRTDLKPKNRVMEVPVSRPLDFYSLVTQNSGLRGDWSPRLQLLMGQDLIKHLQWAFAEPDPLQIQRLKPKPDDPLKLIGLRVSGWEKVGMFSGLVFWIDPQRFWITRTEVENESGAVVRVLKTTAHITDRTFEANTFDFDTTGLTVVNSDWELTAPPDFKPPDSMIGKAAPAIRLKTLSGADYDLAKDPSAVVVVAFAKWDRFQLQFQPWLPKFHRYIQNTGKPVSLYAVSSGQSEEVVRRLWEDQRLSVPVLLDRDEAVKEAFKVGMPQTFIIHQGKIVKEYGGEYMQVVAEVEALLSKEDTKSGPRAMIESTPDLVGKEIREGAKSSVPASIVGKPAPAIRLKTLSGADYDLAKDSSAVVIVDFWTTWCGPCRQALPSLQKFHEWTQKMGKPVSLYAVNCGQTEEVVRKLWKEQQLSIPVLMDKAGEVADAFNVVGLPRTFMIHQSKVVQADMSTDFNMLVAAVEALLAKNDTNDERHGTVRRKTCGFGARAAPGLSNQACRLGGLGAGANSPAPLCVCRACSTVWW
ncbi:MAG: sigma-70 family RNA polymerase sigma factor [Planctomycetota bacterium]|nr:sigma-70 family RNA polymerase sigma factor [Planctomycetota bacterium]